jgi:lambda family phage portal protein
MQIAQAILDRAAQFQAAAAPILYGPNDKPLRRHSAISYQRKAAKREGSMQNWIPRRLYTRQAESMERERIVERSIDLVASDPHASGIVDNFATTVVGPGLYPEPSLDAASLGIDKEILRRIQDQLRAAYNLWTHYADAGWRMSFGEIQYLVKRNMLEYGEFLVLLPMLKDPIRPYSLACMVIHPLRLGTPSDLLASGNIHDGVELGDYGEPVAYWIRNATTSGYMTALGNTSGNYTRVPARRGHRWNVIHGYVQHSPDQVRGMPFFAPAMKYFRDLNDYLDAELVSNVVTAAFSLFIETGAVDPMTMAGALAHHTYTDDDDAESDLRYQELIPGAIMYGSTGQKPHAITADRPGPTFKVFVKEVKKALAMSVNMPYVSLFHDVEETNYAGFRAAMLDAWRVFDAQRVWLGNRFDGPVRKMLVEEAWLRGHIPDISDFYDRMDAYCSCQWIGSPKGNIEPIKEVQADILAINNKLKTRAKANSERGSDWRRTFAQLQEEEEDLRDRGMGSEEQGAGSREQGAGSREEDTDADETD